MTERNDDGPAFPHTSPRPPNANYFGSSGMSLRDYFAAKAMQGALAYSADDGSVLGEELGRMARWSYQAADAMLAAREARDES